MKYYFTDNCYWDHEVKCVYRNDNEVRITDTHKKLLGCLIENNCSMVSYDRLLKSYGVEHPTDNDTNNLWNNIYRNTEKQKGLLARVPEIADYLENQKGTGYRLNIPKQNIQGKNNSSVIRHSRIWLTNTDFPFGKNRRMRLPSGKKRETCASIWKDVIWLGLCFSILKRIRLFVVTL